MVFPYYGWDRISQLYYNNSSFLWRTKKKKQKKVRPKTWPSAFLVTQLPEAVTKTRFAQTVCALLPHAIATLGCVLMGITPSPFKAKAKPDFMVVDSLFLFFGLCRSYFAGPRVFFFDLFIACHRSVSAKLSSHSCKHPV